MERNHRAARRAANRHSGYGSLASVRLRRGALIFVLLSIVSPALAEGLLPIGGAFGNEAGCLLFETGQAVDDTVVILTPDTFQTYGTGCSFETLVSGKPGAYDLSASCASEGDEGEGQFKDKVAVRGSKSAGYTVTIGDGGPEWGPLFTCPGTENLFEPLGLPV
jgi:hypothetical protein